MLRQRPHQHTSSTDLSYRTYGCYPDGQPSWYQKAALSGGSALENGAGDAYYYQGDGSLVFTFREAANPGSAANAAGDSNPAGVSRWTRVCNYGYDAAGNRTTDSETGTANPATFDAENRYNGLAYNDARGNVTDMHHGAPVFHYTYDAENRLTSAANTGSGVTVASFAYDPLGRLCARTINGVASRLYYAGSQLVEERDGANAKVHTFYYGAGGERVGLLVANGAALFYHYDARGFVTHLTNYNGAVVEQYLYDAWGTPFVYNAAGTTSSGQTSQVESNRCLWGADYEWYPEIGLYRCGARFYSPVYARWMQPDPIGQTGGLNLYAYCHNDPVNLVDPSGLDAEADVPAPKKNYGSQPTFTGSNIPGNSVAGSFVSIILGGDSAVAADNNKDFGGAASAGGYWYYPPGSPPATPSFGDAPNTVYVTAFAGVFIPISSALLNGNMQLTLAGGLRNSPDAIQTATSLNPNQNFRREQASSKRIFFTHYKGTGWDPNTDDDSKEARGKYNPYLNRWSLAIKHDFAIKNGLQELGPVYINGNYLGNWDDRCPFNNTIDIYDYSNVPNNSDWGGTIDNAVISSHP